MNSPTSRRSFVQKYVVLPLAAFLAACTGRTTTPTPTAAPPATATTPSTAVPPTATTELALAEPSATTAPVATQPPANTATAMPTLVPTPACGDDDDDEPTIAQTEGPYYTPNTPERTSFLEAGMTGTRMVVTGLVLATDCQPIAAALIDFWHCDDAGIYDNEGYRLRGHQFTDANGRYTLETIMPGLYPGRTRHFHVKVQAPNQPVLTTQLYFPEEGDNARDGIYDASLLMEIRDNADGKEGTFNFVLAV